MNIRDRYSRDQSSIALGSGVNLTYYEGWAPVPALEVRGIQYVVKTVDWIRNSSNTSPSSKPVLPSGYNYWGTSGYTNKDGAVGFGSVNGVEVQEVVATHVGHIVPSEPWVVYDEGDDHLWIYSTASDWVDLGQVAIDTSIYANKIVSGTTGAIVIQNSSNPADIIDSGITINDTGTMGSSATVVPTENTVLNELTDKVDASGWSADQVLISNESGQITEVDQETGFNLPLGSIAGTVAEGNHTHASMGGNVSVFTPAGHATLDYSAGLIYDAIVVTAQPSKIVKIVIPTASLAAVGTKLIVSAIVTAGATVSLYHTDTTVTNLISSMVSGGASTEYHLLMVENSATLWYVLYKLPTFIRQATTSARGIVQLALNGESDATKAVASNDLRLNGSSFIGSSYTNSYSSSETINWVTMDLFIYDSAYFEIYDGCVVDILIPTPSSANIGRKLRVSVAITDTGNFNIYHTDKTLPNLIGTYEVLSDNNNYYYIDIESNGVNWVVIQEFPTRLRHADTYDYGTVKIAADGSSTIGEVVDSSDARLKQATTTQIGVAELATNSEATTATDELRIMTPLRVDEYYKSKLASRAETVTGTDVIKAVTPDTMSYTLRQMFDYTATIVEPITDWHMDTEPTKDVILGGTYDIYDIRAIIYNDAATVQYPLNVAVAGAVQGTIDSYTISTRTITLSRLDGGLFDSTDFNVSSGIRGFLIINYILV